MGEDKDLATPSPEDGPRLIRTLGFSEALAIGAGTMVGAGIFLFPGLAGAEAGMAAVLSFALGAGIALLVALPASELVSAMPWSGGGYQYVSRGLGPLPGTLVGVGQWFGLVFASAFYLSGFGEYLHAFIREFRSGWVPSGPWIGLAGALLITGVALAGTQKAGKLQNIAVGLLLLLFGGLLAVGLAKVGEQMGFPPAPQGDFAPKGLGAVVPTAALVFTSYLGFIQITTVAGDIRDAERTVPKAMLSSIALVAILYILTVFLTTSILPVSRLEELGETALPEVARSLLGRTGALVIFGAGLLATLSSANASILGSSRSMFALGRDEVLPGFVSKIHHRFRTPHWALISTGLPVAVLVLFGRLEILAEVASILHLVMYGLICVSVLAFRREKGDLYQPVFRTPGYPWLPALGAGLSFALIGWMEVEALILGGAVFVGALAWYGLYARNAELSVPGEVKENGE